ncbi:HlyD family efflux transporter periplasmic adaptor subunit [Flammeovirga sp. MY04]|uniref:HlyD family secretion protein n=1 Tax=Flammeovirga sp. MY04 TaxID=1191459 RepID=UPI001451F9CD|nr:HlyD family efflux transporter periplasmic adaptor subunit [Flammeovirga sp. MY04]ANQ50918.2 HlyD family efflux transporter periplasmic adaptor subunit [Flammeovirga sp. MY04]
MKKYEDYLNDISFLEEEVKLASKNLIRNQKLANARAISQKELDQSELQIKKAKSSLGQRQKKAQAEWALDLDEHHVKIENLNAEIAQIDKQIQKHFVYATIGGVLQDFKGIHEGTVLFANQKIGEITPQSDLIAECYITPKDIGWLKEGMSSVFQIDAYNYNDWGTLNGKIKTIYHDVTLIDKQPIFKIKCQLDQDYLTLSNGYKGQIKKGMTLRARFIVTKRSLLDLLYDQTDDWLNPIRNQSSTSISKN